MVTDIANIILETVYGSDKLYLVTSCYVTDTFDMLVNIDYTQCTVKLRSLKLRF